MPNFSSIDFVAKEHRVGTAFVCLAAIEAVCVLPFAYLLPARSNLPIVIVVVIVAVVNSAIFVTIKSRSWSVALLSANLLGIGFSLEIALNPSRFLSSRSHLEIGLICLGVLFLGFFKLPKGPSRAFLTAQQWALACTFISWMLVQQLYEQAATLPATNVRALFIGPPAVVAAALLSGFTGWRKWYIATMVAVGLAQYWIGIFDLAGQLDAPQVGRAALGLMAGFLLVPIAAILSAKSSAGGAAFQIEGQ